MSENSFREYYDQLLRGLGGSPAQSGHFEGIAANENDAGIGTWQGLQRSQQAEFRSGREIELQQRALSARIQISAPEIQNSRPGAFVDAMNAERDRMAQEYRREYERHLRYMMGAQWVTAPYVDPDMEMDIGL